MTDTMPEESVEIALTGIRYDVGARDVGEAVTSCYLGSNNLIRSGGVCQCLVIHEVVVRASVLPLDDTERLIFEALARWMDDTDAVYVFASATDVRTFFDPSNNLISACDDPIISENLEQAAEVVIKTRLHCEF